MSIVIKSFAPKSIFVIRINQITVKITYCHQIWYYNCINNYQEKYTYTELKGNNLKSYLMWCNR